MATATSPTNQPDIAYPNRRQYILWNYQKVAGRDKPIKSPVAETGHRISIHDQHEWMPFDEAQEKSKMTGYGVGFVLTGNDPYFCLDIDDCLHDGTWDTRAATAFSTLAGALMETSVSGTGLHIWGTVDKRQVNGETYRNRIKNQYEFYTDDRFIALGRPWDGKCETDCTRALKGYLTPHEVPGTKQTASMLTVEDRRLIDTALIRRSQLNLDGRAPSFSDLWTGDQNRLVAFYQKEDGSFDPSRADYALAKELAYYSGGNVEQITRLIWQSGLHREKWEKHKGYIASTVRKAVAATKHYHQWQPTAKEALNGHPALSTAEMPIGYVETVSVADLSVQEVKRQTWRVEGLIPDRNVTLLSGSGGVGKSTLALQLGVAVASANHWIGKPVEPGPVVFFSGEDELSVLHQRLTDISPRVGVHLGSLQQMYVASYAHREALLNTLSSSGELGRTPLLRELEQTIAQKSAKLVILETLADLFGGNENNRVHARQFISSLRSIAIKVDCAIVLLSHPSQFGMQSGTGYSGSTAWQGSVRSMLFVEQVDADRSLRRIKHLKSNYGAILEDFYVRYEGGAFVHADADTVLLHAEAEFLRLLRESPYDVGPYPGRGYAVSVFADQTDVSNSNLKKARDNLLRKGKIKISTAEGSQGRSKKVLKIVEKDDLSPSIGLQSPSFASGTTSSLTHPL